jgi:archaellum component FlaC
MANYPPFARALQGRRTRADNLPRPRRAVDDQPELDPVLLPEAISHNDRRHARLPSAEFPPAEQDYVGEINSLRALVSDLENQLTDLTTENKRLQRLQTEAESQRQINEEMQFQLEDVRNQLGDEQTKSKYLTDQVKQLEHFLEGKRQLTEVKERMLERMQNEYQQVMTDYQRILDLNGVQTGQLRQAKVHISELEAQVEELRGLEKLRGKELQEPADISLVDFPFTDADEIQNKEQLPIDLHQEPAVLQAAEPVQQIAPPPMKRAALVDSIKFGNDQSIDVHDDIDSMTVPEMKDLLDILRAQKDEVERQLNRAPQKGRSMAHVRREKEEMEEELEGLSKRIAKIRFALRKLHEL